MRAQGRRQKRSVLLQKAEALKAQRITHGAPESVRRVPRAILWPTRTAPGPGGAVLHPWGVALRPPPWTSCYDSKRYYKIQKSCYKTQTCQQLPPSPTPQHTYIRCSHRSVCLSTTHKLHLKTHIGLRPQCPPSTSSQHLYMCVRHLMYFSDLLPAGVAAWIPPGTSHSLDSAWHAAWNHES